ncbi:hypothetical protein L1049_006366 [Liquidambar formosana]|uniref:Transmembrane protein n=1 Tax=Liquidambar formosana TaxID=63359 RepID=A0AAP0RFA8_LIQFO
MRERERENPNKTDKVGIMQERREVLVYLQVWNSFFELIIHSATLAWSWALYWCCVLHPTVKRKLEMGCWSGRPGKTRLRFEPKLSNLFFFFFLLQLDFVLHGNHSFISLFFFLCLFDQRLPT